MKLCAKFIERQVEALEAREVEEEHHEIGILVLDIRVVELQHRHRAMGMRLGIV
jgi:hypothetical protein